MNMVQSGQYHIRKAEPQEWEQAMNLAWETFLVFQTKEYGKEGIESFRDFVSDRDLKKMFLADAYKMFLAFHEGRMVGLITLRNGCHISLLFVDKEYQKQGVGSALVTYLSHYLLDEKGITYMTVDAAPNAVDFYHKMGFWDLAPMQFKQGISYTSMKKNIK